MKRAAAVARRVGRQMLRDRRTLVLMILAPVVIMSLLAWLLRAQSEPFRLAVVAPGDEGAMSRSILVQLLTRNANVRIVEGVAPAGVVAALQAGRIQGALLLRSASPERLKAGERMKIEVWLEGSDPTIGREFFREFQNVVRPFLDALRSLLYLSDEDIEMIMPPEIERHYLYGGQDFTEADFFAPVLIAFMAFFFVFLLTAVSFLRERSRGTMERLLASPLTRFELIGGYFFGLLGFALAQTAVVVLFALYALKIHYLGNLAAIVVVELILVVGASNMGILFSTFAKNEFQVAQFIPLVILPQVFLSGVLWSIETMPKILQYCAYALPLTYANLALRKLMIKGFSLDQVLPEISALILFALLMIAGSVIAIKRVAD